jgi:hypothetical protein
MVFPVWADITVDRSDTDVCHGDDSQDDDSEGTPARSGHLAETPG